MLHSLKHSEEPNVAAGRTSRGLEAAISTAAQPAPSGWYRVSNRRGDFWLVDDDWGGHLQKVCVFRIGFVTRRLVSDVQALLDSEFSDWGVMIQLEINDSSESIPPEGLIVYADSVEEAWDAEQLARVFGKKFVSASQAERIATEHANTTLASVPSPLAPRAGSLQDRNMMVP